METKIEKISELSKLLSVKSRMSDDLNPAKREVVLVKNEK